MFTLKLKTAIQGELLNVNSRVDDFDYLSGITELVAGHYSIVPRIGRHRPPEGKKWIQDSDRRYWEVDSLELAENSE